MFFVSLYDLQSYLSWYYTSLCGNNWYSTKASIKWLKAEEHSPAHYEASLWPSPGVLCIHIITISWRALPLANISLFLVKCSVSVPGERPCGIALCVHITLILGIKACAAAHARRRRRTRVQQWENLGTALNRFGLERVEVASKNIQCWMTVFCGGWSQRSWERRYYPAAAGSLEPQGESEFTQERLCAYAGYVTI